MKTKFSQTTACRRSTSLPRIDAGVRKFNAFVFFARRPELEDLSSEDEAVATDLDMHALILSSSTDTHSPEEPLKTAEEVLREIDDIMQV